MDRSSNDSQQDSALCLLPVFSQSALPWLTVEIRPLLPKVDSYSGTTKAENGVYGGLTYTYKCLVLPPGDMYFTYTLWDVLKI